MSDHTCPLHLAGDRLCYKGCGCRCDDCTEMHRWHLLGAPQADPALYLQDLSEGACVGTRGFTELPQEDQWKACAGCPVRDRCPCPTPKPVGHVVPDEPIQPLPAQRRHGPIRDADWLIAEVTRLREAGVADPDALAALIGYRQTNSLRERLRALGRSDLWPGRRGPYRKPTSRGPHGFIDAIEKGLLLPDLVARFSVQPESIKRALQRAGRGDLWQRIAHRERRVA